MESLYQIENLTKVLTLINYIFLRRIGMKDCDKYIIYIANKINELRLCHRKEVLQMILYSNIDQSKIKEKGNGTQIKFSELSPDLIKNIYNFVYNKVENSTDIIS